MYFKRIENGYISFVGVGDGGEIITESEYQEIMEVIHSKPKDTENIGYKLKADLSWEPYEKEPIPDQEEIDDSEAVGILLGGAS